MAGHLGAYAVEMNPPLHISHSFGSVGGAGIAAASREGLRLTAGPFDWRRVLVRRLMRFMCLPMDVSAGVVSIGLRNVIETLKPGRVFVHWIGNEMLRYEELKCLKGIPVTVVLHDFSMFEPPPYRKATWFDRWRLRRIDRVLRGLDVDYEAPSEWAAKHIGELRPNARVTIRRTPVRAAFHDKKGGTGDHSRFRLLFGCQGGRTNPYKGFADLESALDLLPDTFKSKMELHLFGEESDECLTAGVKTMFHGVISDGDELAELYRSCDALAFPSISETQGLVKDEALACGLKVVCFNRTACPEGIAHKSNGYVAKDIPDFANGLKWAYDATRREGGI